MKIKLILLILPSLFCLNSILSQTIHWKDFDKSVFEQAKKENKFILLDLGATWCHWCHVMDDSSYSNKTVIDLLSKKFISTKANQDKRPDLNAKYKDYGWPATIIFDSNGKELAKETGYIAPAEFIELLKSIGTNVETSAKAENQSLSPIGNYEQRVKREVFNFLDMEKGGFDMGQKYLEYDAFEYALFNCNANDTLKTWLHKTVQNSLHINDPAWGGVYQYSTGYDWYYPHFEKLLSVQARYINMYAKYYNTFKDTTVLKKAIRIDDYLTHFLKSKSNLYYNSQDADLVEGEHAGEYFALSSDDRLKKGIPRIDSTCYVKENAQLAEAFLYLWVTTGNEKYKTKSINMLKELIADYKEPNGGYLHQKSYSGVISLADQLYLCRALVCCYTLTGQHWSIDEAKRIEQYMINNFKNAKGGYYSYKPSPDLLEPNSIVNENIDLCRLLNKLSYITNNDELKKEAEGIFAYVTSDAVLQETFSESDILICKNELKKEPFKAELFLESDSEPELELALQKLLLSSNNSYVVERYLPNQPIPEKYSYMKDAAGNKNCIFLCTSSYCSSPLHNKTDIESFIFK